MLRPGPDRGSDVGGATASFPVALTIGITYVFGMVTPLAVIALVWDRRDWGASWLLRDRKVRLGRARSVPLTTAVSAALMIMMGVLTSALAVTGQGMATSGWQVGAPALGLPRPGRPGLVAGLGGGSVGARRFGAAPGRRCPATACSVPADRPPHTSAGDDLPAKTDDPAHLETS
jgi:hypothetical protein